MIFGCYCIVLKCLTSYSIVWTWYNFDRPSCANIVANLTRNAQVLIFSYRTSSGEQPLRELPFLASIVGSVVEFSPATRETGVRFPDNADHFRQYCNRSKILVRPTLRVGFEPTREDPIWFLVKRLNHSAIAARDCWHTKYWWWLGSLLNRRKVVLRWIQSEYEVNTVHASYVYTNR